MEVLARRLAALVGIAVVLSVGLAAADADTGLLLRHLESVPDSQLHAYGLADDGGRTMDCLEVFQPSGLGHGKVYGVHHTRRDGVFSICLVRSEDLLRWTHVRLLDVHASQAAVWECDGGGFLLAYEKDRPNSCWIRVRFYENLSQLCAGEFAREFDIRRELAPTAEGTPSFESVKMLAGEPSDSTVRLRFHYFKDVRADRLAIGTLTNFESWEAAPMKVVDSGLEKRGESGNFGDRDRFEWEQKVYFLQEVQRLRGDWSSWGVYLCDGTGMPIRRLSFRTHAGSKAFCNPSATWITDADGERKLVVTLFLPSEGAGRGEAGELLFVVDPG